MCSGQYKELGLGCGKGVWAGSEGGEQGTGVFQARVRTSGFASGLREAAEGF